MFVLMPRALKSKINDLKQASRVLEIDHLALFSESFPNKSTREERWNGAADNTLYLCIPAHMARLLLEIGKWTVKSQGVNRTRDPPYMTGL